jgi:hypothetical protein
VNLPLYFSPSGSWVAGVLGGPAGRIGAVPWVCLLRLLTRGKSDVFSVNVDLAAELIVHSVERGVPRAPIGFGIGEARD